MVRPEKTGSIQSEVIDDLLSRFPRVATLTVARMAYAANPKLWSSLETCRSMVRYARGNSGCEHRKLAANKQHYRANGKLGDPFGEIPDGFTQIGDFTPFRVTKPGRHLILSDIHAPYHDKTALCLALDRDADCIIINGDLWDCYACSQWETDPRERDLSYEVLCVHDILAAIRKRHPKTRVIAKLGNHEERWERYLACKAPELLGVAEFETEKILHFDDYGIECVRDRRPILLGSIFYLIHGHEFKPRMTSPVNPARALFLRAKTVCMCGDFHQASTHQATALNGKIIRTWSTGCLCDLHPRYMPLNEWSHGFAEVILDKNGAPSANLKAIIDEKVWN